jgi:acetyl esterase/lipase
MLKLKSYITLFFVLTRLAGFTQAENDTSYKPVKFPDGYTAKLNEVYVTATGWEGKMDLYLPPKNGNPVPVIINIHGGGWNHGKKESQTGFSTFFKAGFAVANIEYRLTGEATAPAAVEDARCALVYIVSNAKSLNIDADKIVVIGGSAGGHLALMAGLLGNNKLFDTNCTGNQTVKVAAIIDKYGITDVWDWAYGKDITSKSAVKWLGGKAKDSVFAKSVSPIHYVDAKSPPVLIIHGNADSTVPYQHSVNLYSKLKSVKVFTEFITVEGGGHGKFEKEKNSEINKAIIEFLKKINIKPHEN